MISRFTGFDKSGDDRAPSPGGHLGKPPPCRILRPHAWRIGPVSGDPAFRKKRQLRAACRQRDEQLLHALKVAVDIARHTKRLKNGNVDSPWVHKKS
jgi:hypothetical protein